MRTLAVLAAVTGLQACAFTPVPLTMPPSVGTGLTGGENRVIVIGALADGRPRPGQCGEQKNGYGAETAPATCSTDPAAWLTTLLASELRAAGFDVVEASTKPTALQLSGTLLQLYVEPVIGFSTIALETDIRVTLVATAAVGLAAERTFFVKGSESAMMATHASFQKSLDMAARLVVKDVVVAILSLMNRYPELGAVRAPDGGRA